MDNDEALQSGFQVGNAWAAQWARNRQQKIANATADKDRENRLIGDFGEAAVVGPDGRVNVLESARRMKELQDRASSEGSQGFVKAFDQNVVGGQPVEPNAAPDMSRFNEAFQQKYGRPPQRVDVQQTAPPVLPGPNAVTAGEIPDITGWSASKQAGFMKGYPVAQAQQQKDYATQARNAIDQERIASRTRELELRIKSNEQIASDRNASAEERQAAKISLEEQKLDFQQEKLKTDWFQRGKIADSNALAKQKSAELVAQSKPNQGDEQVVQTLATREANAIVGSAELDNLLNTMRDPTKELSTKRFQAQTSFKTINSALWGSDAVSAPEADRIGSYLNITGVGEWIKSGKLPPPNPEMFIKAIQEKKDKLDATIKTIRSERGALTAKYSKQTAAGGQPPSGSEAKPAAVPQIKWDAMTPAQRTTAVQLFK